MEYLADLGSASVEIGQNQNRTVTHLTMSRLFLRLVGICELGERLMKDRSHDEAMAELFQAGPSYADELLTEVARDGDVDELAILELHLSAAFAMREADRAS